MAIYQKNIKLKARPKGLSDITGIILDNLPELPDTGLLNIFIKHTSAALTINENADPDVLADMETIYDRLVPEQRGYRHTLEGPDDMPAHAKSSITGTSLNIPVTEKRLNLGTWQGIYLYEFREDAPRREIILTLLG